MLVFLDGERMNADDECGVSTGFGFFFFSLFSPPGFQGVEGLSSGSVQISIRFLAHDSGMPNVVCFTFQFCSFSLFFSSG
jgi:hypothetical protein